MKSRYPNHCCPQCGEPIGWLGRAMEWALGWLTGRHECRVNWDDEL